MNKIFQLCIFLNLFCISSYANQALEIVDFTGSPTLKTIEGQVISLKKGPVLIESDLNIEILETQYLKIKLNQNYEVTLASAGSYYLDLQIEKSTILIKKFKINNGEVYIKSTGEYLNPLNIETPLSLKQINDEKSFQNLNTLFQFDIEKTKVIFCQKEGLNLVTAFEHEKSFELGANEEIFFQGQKNKSQEIEFDQLLQGRKVPRGFWGEKTKCNFDRFDKLQAQILKKHQEKIAALNKKRQLEIQKKKAMDDQYLCHDPYGQLNQCSWQIRGQICLRQRCNAQGVWSDSVELSIKSSPHCKSKVSVDRCNY